MCIRDSRLIETAQEIAEEGFDTASSLEDVYKRQLQHFLIFDRTSQFTDLPLENILAQVCGYDNKFVSSDTINIGLWEDTSHM